MSRSATPATQTAAAPTASTGTQACHQSQRRKCHASHAECTSMSSSATPATQTAAATTASNETRGSAVVGSTCTTRTSLSCLVNDRKCCDISATKITLSPQPLLVSHFANDPPHTPPHICPNHRRPATAEPPSTEAPLRPAQENNEKSLRYCPKRALLSFTFANSPLFSTQGAILPHKRKHAPTQPNSSRLEHAARCITMPVNSRSFMFESSLAMPPEPSHFVEHDIRFP